MPKMQLVRKYQLPPINAVTGTASSSGGGSGAAADTVDGFHASAAALANTLCALNADAEGPFDITGDAETLDGYEATDFLSPQYLVLVANDNLSAERVLTAGDGIDGTDAGAGSTYTVAVDVSDFAGAGLEDDGSNNLRIAATAAGAGLTGGGGSALAVGAGTLITVGADTVGVSVGTAQYQFIVSGADPFTPGWSAGFLNIGSGKTLTLEDSVSITAAADPLTLAFPITVAHTNVITTSSNPGAAAAILATTAAGAVRVKGIGAGSVAPACALHSQDTSEQLRLGYDAGGYASFTVADGGGLTIATTTDNSTGSLTLAPAGDIIINPTGNDVLPTTGYDINLGSLAKKYLTLHAAELWVETLVAQNTIATIGGRILVGPTTELTADLSDAATQIVVKHNELTAGDTVYLEANGAVEFILVGGYAITAATAATDTFAVAGDKTADFPVGKKFTVVGSTGNDGEWTVKSCTFTIATAIVTDEDVTDDTDDGTIVYTGTQGTGPYTYLSVTRDRDGSGANAWYAGDAVFNTGAAGDGWIDLYSVGGVAGVGAGPTICGNVRDSDTYNDWTPHWAIGNLNGIFGIADNYYGVALGDYAGGNYLLYENNDGFVLHAGDGAVLIDSGGIQVTSDGGDVTINAGGIQVALYTGGSAWSSTAGYKFYDTDEDSIIGGLSLNKSSGNFYGYLGIQPAAVADAALQIYAVGGSSVESRVQMIAYGPGSPVPSAAYLTVKVDASDNAWIEGFGDNLYITGDDVRIAGGLYVGAINVDPDADDVWCDGEVSTDGGTTRWDLGGYAATAPAATGYVTLTINGTAYKLLAATVA